MPIARNRNYRVIYILNSEYCNFTARWAGMGLPDFSPPDSKMHAYAAAFTYTIAGDEVH